MLMTAADPQEGSFCYYAEKAYGKLAGFSCGWNYWCSNILIMGSQLTALSILSRFWFHDVPLWIFAAVYAVLSIFVVMLGPGGFDKVENLFAVIKVAAIVMFIILSMLAFFKWSQGITGKPGIPQTEKELFSGGMVGFWSSLIYAFYAYGGIEVIGLLAMQLKDKKDAPKAGTIMLITLMVIYVTSLALAVILVPTHSFTDKESPFVTALSGYHLSFFPHVFNGAIIIAGFSTLTAALFGVTNLLITLAKDGDAPSLFAKKIKFKDLPLSSLSLGAVGLSGSVITALLVPGKIYEYITTAAGILLMYNWFFIIISSNRIIKLRKLEKFLSFIGMILIIASVSGTILEKEIRPGFYISLLFVLVIGFVCVIMKKSTWNKDIHDNKSR